MNKRIPTRIINMKDAILDQENEDNLVKLNKKFECNIHHCEMQVHNFHELDPRVKPKNLKVEFYVTLFCPQCNKSVNIIEKGETK